MLMDNVFNTIFDSVANDVKDETAPKKQEVVFDGAVIEAEDNLSDYEITNLRLNVAGAIQAWLETNDLAEEETLQDRLDALFIGIIDADKNGDISEDEAVLFELVYNIAAEFLLFKGVDEEDVALFIGDADEDAAKRIHELLINIAPDGEEAEIDEVNEFAFGEESVEDAAYKKKVAIRNGKKVIIKKRVSGRVKLSAAQKIAVKKMQRKSHSGAARLKRAKSLRKRASMGL